MGYCRNLIVPRLQPKLGSMCSSLKIATQEWGRLGVPIATSKISNQLILDLAHRSCLADPGGLFETDVVFCLNSKRLGGIVYL